MKLNDISLIKNILNQDFILLDNIKWNPKR